MWKNKEDRKIEDDIGIKCPKCGKECKLMWQTFSTAIRHIRQLCPEHGYIRFAPQFEEYIKIADQTKTYESTLKVSKSLFDY